MARPKLEIDWKVVDKMLEADCEGTEVAARLGIDPTTLYARCKEENNICFSLYLQQKKSDGNATIKETQFKVATVDKDKTMLVWLGKQRLGQKDKTDITTSGEKITGFNYLTPNGSNDNAND